VADEQHGSATASDAEIVRRAVKRNWPSLEPGTRDYEHRLLAVEKFFAELGQERFELYFNLRSPVDLRCFAFFGQSNSLFWRAQGVLSDVEEEQEETVTGSADLHG